MKVILCKNCGAKYQLEDEDNVRDYECSVCAGDLEFLESYPSGSSGKSVSSPPKEDSNDSELVYCTDCGLKYQLGPEDNISDFECSSCYGNLRYANEELNEELNDGEDQTDNYAAENELATNPQDNEEARASDISTDKIDVTNVMPFETRKESKLRESLKEEFLNNVDEEYSEEETIVATESKDEKIEKISISKDFITDSKDISSKKVIKDTIDDSKKIVLENEDESGFKRVVVEDHGSKEVILENEDEGGFKRVVVEDHGSKEVVLENEDEGGFEKVVLENEDKTTKESKIEEKKSSETEKTNDKKESIKKESKQKTEKDKIPTKNKSTKTFKKSSSSDKKSKTDKRELVSNPKIKGRLYHDFFIELGLIIALVGVVDIVLTEGRLFSITFVTIGVIVFLIGLILNKKYRDSKAREKLVREKLLTLPKDFYVLSYVKLPDADSQIDHVVVGPTGVFTILTQEYKTKKNKKKPSLAIATSSLSKNIDINVNRNAILNFNKRDKTEFEDNNEVKQMSIQLTKNLIEYLGENGLNRFYIEPLICFINKKVSIINIVLTDEDLFLEELLTKISNEDVKLDYTTLNKCAALLAEYSAESS